MKTKIERKKELYDLLASGGQGIMKIRNLACEYQSRSPGTVELSEVGTLISEYIRVILDYEFPNDDSTQSDRS